MADSGTVVGDHDLDSEDVVTVAELNGELTEIIEGAADLHHDYVVGDATDCGVANGHVHFDLVYDDASIHCVLFGFRRNDTSTTPEEDSQVAVQGDLSFYEPQGSCSLLVTDVVEVGDSEYRQVYEQAREQLAADGLFDDGRKQELPAVPGTVGLVTSADSDARTDAVTAIHDRYPDVDVVVKHASVQGEDALPELLEAVSALDRDAAVDVLVVTRGGGADRTLRVFDEPALCRAIAETGTPVCVGVGHENDRTLADEVADHRVMTPTHAGEVVPERAALEQQFDGLESSLASAYESRVERRLTALGRDLAGAYDRCVATRLAELERELDAAHTTVERAKTLEAEKERAVAEARREAAKLRARQRRRYRVAVAVLVALVLALAAYIVL